MNAEPAGMSNGNVLRNCAVGMTLLELIIVSSLLLILASAALPVFRYKVVRDKEFELRRDLREMRDAIDHTSA
jgi:general secretion pathway protein G